MSTRGYCGFILNDRHYTHYQHGTMYPDGIPSWLAKEASTMVKEDPDVWKKAVNRLTNEQTFITDPDYMLPPDILKKVADTHPNPKYRDYLQPDMNVGFSDSHHTIASDFLPVYQIEEVPNLANHWFNEPSFKKMLEMPTLSLNHDDLTEDDTFIRYMVLADLDNNQYLVLGKKDDIWGLVLAADIDNPVALEQAAKKLETIGHTGWDGTPVGSARRDLSKPVPSGAGFRRPDGFPPLDKVVDVYNFIIKTDHDYYAKAKEGGLPSDERTHVNFLGILEEEVDPSWDARVKRVLDEVDTKLKELDNRIKIQFNHDQMRAARIVDPNLVPLLKSDPVYTKIMNLKLTRMYSNQAIATMVGVKKWKVDKITRGMPAKLR